MEQIYIYVYFLWCVGQMIVGQIISGHVIVGQIISGHVTVGQMT